MLTKYFDWVELNEAKRKSKRTKTPDSNKLDNWLKEIDSLEGSVSKLRSALDKKKKTFKNIQANMN